MLKQKNLFFTGKKNATQRLHEFFYIIDDEKKEWFGFFVFDFVLFFACVCYLQLVVFFYYVDDFV